jgi:dTDP-L-rhamnose 4-epimerase
MSVYGEGLYETDNGVLVEDAARTRDAAVWDPVGPNGETLHPLPTPETKRLNLASVYALTKYAQERLVLTVCTAYGMEAVALRLFNVYGAGQALSNPYTGVLAIFASRLLNGERPVVFEDGRQRRDFVHVDDAARAFELALNAERADGGVFNIGSGRSVSIGDIATRFAKAMGRSDLAPEFVGKARTGDIRHCFADIRRAADGLGFRPERGEMDESFVELAHWVSGQRATDRVGQARDELEARGLARGLVA